MEGREPEPTAPASERCSRLVAFGACYFAFCCLFWFGASYQGMMPRCAGPYDERALFAGGAALGPLSPLLLEGYGVRMDASAAVVAALALALLTLAHRFRQVLVLRLLGYAVVFAWILFGCVAGVVRIT